MYYINCRMCWVQLSGTQRPRLLLQLSFYLILILIYFNAWRREPRNLSPIASGGEDGPGSGEGTVTRGESVLLAQNNLCSISISEEMGPGGACIHPPTPPQRPRLLVSGAGFDVEPPHFSISTQTQFQNIPLSFLVVDFYLKWSWLFYFEPLMEVHLGVVRLGGRVVRHLQFIFPCVITLRVCSVVFD